jgi:hypothetical protein
MLAKYKGGVVGKEGTTECLPSVKAFKNLKDLKE